MGQVRYRQWNSLLLYVYLKRVAQKITSSVASISAFPQIPRILLSQVFFPLHLTCSLAFSPEATYPARFPVVCLLVTQKGGNIPVVYLQNLGTVRCQPAWWCRVRFMPPFLPIPLLGCLPEVLPPSYWKSSRRLQCEQLRSNNTPVLWQRSSHPGSQLTCKRRGPKVTMRNLLESPIWKIFYFFF